MCACVSCQVQKCTLFSAQHTKKIVLFPSQSSPVFCPFFFNWPLATNRHSCVCAHASSNNDGVSSTPAYVPACLQRTTLCFFISLFFPSVYMSARHSGIGRLCSIYIPLYYTFFPTLPKKFVRKAFT